MISCAIRFRSRIDSSGNRLSERSDRASAGVAGVVAVDIDSLYRTGKTVKLNKLPRAELP